jgi:hypothetical protein
MLDDFDPTDLSWNYLWVSRQCRHPRLCAQGVVHGAYHMKNVVMPLAA